MPSRAIIRSGGGWSGFGPNPEEEQRARSGVETSYRLDEEQRYREREARLVAHEQAVEELNHQRFLQKVAESDAKAKRLAEYESQMTKAIPELYAIDPASPDAPKQRAALAAKYPNLFNKEPGIPSIVEEFGQHTRLTQQIQQERQKADQERQSVIDRERLQDKRESAISDRQDKSLDARESRATAASDAKEAAAVAKARAAHGMASAKTDELQSRLDKNREYFNAETDATDKDQSKRAILDKSFQQLQKEHDAAAMTKSILETVHPEVLTPAEPVQNPNLTPPAANPSPANVSSTTPPANPNLTTPPPATEQDQAAPVGEDTVAPIAAVTAPPNLAPSQGASVGAPSVPPASVVGDSPVPPAAVVVPVSPEAQPTATPHPYEGKRVLQKSTGKYGTFTNGQFIPEGTEAQ